MKTCNKCNLHLPLNAFALQKMGKNGRRASCKECVKQTYLRSKEGLVIKMHSNQRAKSKQRNHAQPSYSKEELLNWCLNQPIFHTMYDNWVKSNYSTSLIPTCDRIDDYIGYTLDNIQLRTCQDNIDKSYSDSKNGINTKRAKAVSCYDLEENWLTDYHSISAAAKAFNTSPANIRNVCEAKPIKVTNKDGTTREYLPSKVKNHLFKYKE